MTEEQAIREVVGTWIRASLAGDTATVLTLMADDVVFLLAGREPMRGKAAFAAASEPSGPRPQILDARSEIEEIRVLGDWAYLVTKLAISMRLPDGKTVKRAGNTLSILQKRDGRWLFVRDANMLAVVPS